MRAFGIVASVSRGYETGGIVEIFPLTGKRGNARRTPGKPEVLTGRS
jgi:hypothetical protein